MSRIRTCKVRQNAQRVSNDEHNDGRNDADARQRTATRYRRSLPYSTPCRIAEACLPPRFLHPEPGVLPTTRYLKGTRARYFLYPYPRSRLSTARGDPSGWVLDIQGCIEKG